MPTTNTEKRQPRDGEPRIYKCTPRPIGLGWGACMVCGHTRSGAVPDMAMFVPSRETGEAIVALFLHPQNLDYRKFEPQWIQVKLTVCEQHKPNLVRLQELIRQTDDRNDGPGISKEMVEEVTK